MANTRTYTPGKNKNLLVIPVEALLEIFARHGHDCIEDYKGNNTRLRVAMTSGSLIEIEGLLLEMKQKFAPTKYVRDAMQGVIDELKSEGDKEHGAAHDRISAAEERAKQEVLDRGRLKLQNPYFMDVSE